MLKGEAQAFVRSAKTQPMLPNIAVMGRQIATTDGYRSVDKSQKSLHKKISFSLISLC